MPGSCWHSGHLYDLSTQHLKKKNEQCFSLPLAAQNSSASFPINKPYLWEFRKLSTVCSEAVTHSLSWQSWQSREHLLRKESQTEVVSESRQFLPCKLRKPGDKGKRGSNPWPWPGTPSSWLSSHLCFQGETRLERRPSPSAGRRPLCVGTRSAQLPRDSGGKVP